MRSLWRRLNRELACAALFVLDLCGALLPWLLARARVRRGRVYGGEHQFLLLRLAALCVLQGALDLTEATGPRPFRMPVNCWTTCRRSIVAVLRHWKAPESGRVFAYPLPMALL